MSNGMAKFKCNSINSCASASKTIEFGSSPIIAFIVARENSPFIIRPIATLVIGKKNPIQDQEFRNSNAYKPSFWCNNI